MSDAIFIANKASGHLAIGDKKEMDKATWRKPRGIRVNTYLSLYPRQAVPQARLNTSAFGTFETVLTGSEIVR